MISDKQVNSENRLKVEVTGRYVPTATSVIIDCSAILWVVHWPTQGTVQYIIGNHSCILRIMGKMKDADVYLIFDKYEYFSIKGVTRTARGKEASGHHQLSLSMHLPPQKVVLAVTYNKVQLVDVIVETLLAQKQQLTSTNHKLVVWSQGEIKSQLRSVME